MNVSLRWKILRLIALACVGTGFVMPVISRAQSVTPYFAACGVNAAGQFSCTATSGTTCSYLNPYSEKCTGNHGSATCSLLTNGTVSCNTGSTSVCYQENGVEKCYGETPQGDSFTPPLISVLPTAVSWSSAQTIGTTSSVTAVVFTTANMQESYSITGFVITGDFQITGYMGSCTSGSANSYCRVYLSATPRLPGVRSGYLSMVTSVGTIAVPISITGGGLPATASADKNAALAQVPRAAPATPQALQQLSALPRSEAGPDVKAQAALGCGPDDFPAPGSGAAPVPIIGLRPIPIYDPDKILDPNITMTSPDISFKRARVLGSQASGANTSTSPRASQFGGATLNLAIANQTETQADFDPSFPAPISFIRTYNSLGFISAGVVTQNIGIGWRSNWDLSIVRSGATIATVNRGTGQAYVYTYDATSGKWVTDADVAATLAQTKDSNGYAIGWTLTLPDGTVEQYDALGRIAAVNVLQGTGYAVSYDASGRLASVQNNYGRAITFAYDAAGRLASLTDPSGAVTQYTYDASGRLIEVTYPDQRTVQYVYENTTWPFALTGIIHGYGVRFATFTYDAQGRPTSNQFAGGVGGGSVTYPSSQTATIT